MQDEKAFEDWEALTAAATVADLCDPNHWRERERLLIKAGWPTLAKVTGATAAAVERADKAKLATMSPNDDRGWLALAKICAA